MIFPELPQTTSDAPVDTTPEAIEVETEIEAEAEPFGSDITGEGPASSEMFELKIDGKTIQVTKEDLIARAQKSSGAEARLKTAQKERADALRLIELAKSDPFALIKELNPLGDEKSAISKRLAQLMEEEMMSPEEKAHRADMEELLALRTEKSSAKQKLEEAELEAQVAQQQQKFDTEISEAIVEVGLPKNVATIKRVAEYLLEAYENNIEIPVKKVAQMVKADIRAEAQAILSGASEEDFADLLGKDLLTKAQKSSLANIKRPGNPVNPQAKKDAPKPDKKVTGDDWLREHGIF
jgi:hypothetical protein